MTYLIYQNLVLVTATVNICDGMCTTVYTCDQPSSTCTLVIKAKLCVQNRFRSDFVPQLLTLWVSQLPRVVVLLAAVHTSHMRQFLLSNPPENQRTGRNQLFQVDIDHIDIDWWTRFWWNCLVEVNKGFELVVQGGERVRAELNLVLPPGRFVFLGRILLTWGPRVNCAEERDIAEQCTHDSTISGSLCERVHTGKFSES